MKNKFTPRNFLPLFRSENPKPENVPLPKVLPMDMTSGQALEEWTAHWLRVTDPSHLGGEARHLDAYATRYESLCVQEQTGRQALPVALPVAPQHQHVSENVQLCRILGVKIREGVHLASNQKAKLTRSWLQNKRAKGELV